MANSSQERSLQEVKIWLWVCGLSRAIEGAWGGCVQHAVLKICTPNRPVLFDEIQEGASGAEDPDRTKLRVAHFRTATRVVKNPGGAAV